MSVEITKSEFDAGIVGLESKIVSQPTRQVTVYSDPRTSTEWDLYAAEGKYFAGEEWLHLSRV